MIMITLAYQQLIIPAFEAVLELRATYRFWRQLEKSQWWSRERLEDLQLRRLRQIIGYCFAHSPYYRDLWNSHGLRLATLQSLSDLARWPVMSRQAVRDHADRIRAGNERGRVVAKSTGGSSGVPLRFVIDRPANDRRVAAANRGYKWAGAAPGTRQTHLWGVALSQQSLARRWKDRLYSRVLYRRDMLSSFELSDGSIPRFLRRLHRYRPDVLVAYTNPLYQFARAIDQCGLRAYQPRTIVVGAEKLHGFQREMIERVFAAPVYETYGSREFTLIGAECDHHAGLHVTSENPVVEVVNDQGQPVRPGEEGDVLVTDLFNVAMPFVRYAIGDRAIASSESCCCGRGLPLLKKVVGRQLDVLTTVDGRRLAGEFFPHLLKDCASVRQFQAVQSRRNLVELKLVVDSHWGADERESLCRVVQRSIGESTRLLIHEVDRILLTKTGKLRVVVGCRAEEPNS
jgi:phenylacetate-CoA ligase